MLLKNIAHKYLRQQLQHPGILLDGLDHLWVHRRIHHLTDIPLFITKIPYSYHDPP